MQDNNNPGHLKYTKEHEWIQIEGSEVTIGITYYAQNALGDIVYIELPERGTKIQKDSTFGVVESIKSVSDLFGPLSGEVIDVNDDLVETPEAINQSPYRAWLIRIKMANIAELNSLMDASSYEEYCLALA